MGAVANALVIDAPFGRAQAPTAWWPEPEKELSRMPVRQMKIQVRARGSRSWSHRLGHRISLTDPSSLLKGVRAARGRGPRRRARDDRSW